MLHIESEFSEIKIVPSGLNPMLGHIRGKVTDIDGKGLKHSRIWIRETGRSTYTDNYGNFVLINVVPAIYTLIAENEGYTQAVLTDISVESGDNPGNRFIMHPKYSKPKSDPYRAYALRFAQVVPFATL